MTLNRGAVSVVGAGLAGPLLAILLARRGFSVTLYERRGDPRLALADAGRSINLALAARGIRALEHAGIMDRVRPLMVPMRGRMVHEPDRTPRLLPYGQREHEVIYSVGRGALNRLLIEEAARLPGITLRFACGCTDVSIAHDRLRLHEAEPQGRVASGERTAGRGHEVPLAPTIATDGAGSAVRASLQAQGLVAAREEPLDHDYKELEIPAREGRPVLDPNALHIWPRRGFMLIALPNTDGSFTATLFLPRAGAVSFAALATEHAVQEFFSRELADALPLFPSLVRQFREHPQGRLGTLHVAPWHVRGDVLLLGDAAHAIVPFHGQGMNAAFEDCRVLDERVGSSARADGDVSWETLFGAFEAERRPDAEAIARMAIENYREMREAVLDPRFLRQKSLALELERRYPDRFIPRYSMVMFHPEITFAEAERRGAAQQEILRRLTDHAPEADELDEGLAHELVTSRLTPVPAR